MQQDRVQTNGEAVYSPGYNWVDHADDNVPFGALLVSTYVGLTGNFSYFCAVEPTILLGFNFINRSAAGLVYNSPVAPNCTYGFTDTIAKTGQELFTTLLYYQASLAMANLSVVTGCGNASDYAARAALIAENINQLWDESSNMFYAADIDNKFDDVWGSLFAVHLGLVPEQWVAQAIVDHVAANRSNIFQSGQVRHLIYPQLWERCIETCPTPGTYQNGGFWATPLAWVLPVLAKYGYEDLAVELFNAAVFNFRLIGIMECL